MSTQAEQVAASQGRQRIPTEWLIEFQTWTDGALQSLIDDDAVSRADVKAYAAWELDYRLAFDVPGPKQPTLGVRNDGRKLDELVKRHLVAQGGKA